MLLGDICRILSAVNAMMYITTAHIRRIKYRQGEVGTLMLASKNIQACLLDTSPKGILMVWIDTCDPRTAVRRRVRSSVTVSIVRFKNSCDCDRGVQRTFGCDVVTLPIVCQCEWSD